jgi:ribonuclease-3
MGASDGVDSSLLAERLQYEFVDPGLLVQALRHRSWCSEHPGNESNERLEFLGDAVLGWVVADLVYRRHLGSHEGRLTDLRKSVVNAVALAEIARELDVGPFLLLGRGEAGAGGRNKASILSDALEAIIGAVYLDGGAESAYQLVLQLLGERLDGGPDLSPFTDFKTMLQEMTAHRFDQAPVYVLTETGPDHAKLFRATVLVSGEMFGEGEGTSKKQAEQHAAHEAVRRLQTEAAAQVPGA